MLQRGRRVEEIEQTMSLVRQCTDLRRSTVESGCPSDLRVVLAASCSIGVGSPRRVLSSSGMRWAPMVVFRPPLIASLVAQHRIPLLSRGSGNHARPPEAKIYLRSSESRFDHDKYTFELSAAIRYTTKTPPGIRRSLPANHHRFVDPPASRRLSFTGPSVAVGVSDPH
jgi:hypothetical protein